MEWQEYVDSLEKISLEDTISIIEEIIDDPEKQGFYGFKEQRDLVFFGEEINGRIMNPYLVTCRKDDNLSERFYDLMNNAFTNFNYNYIHHANGTKDYVAYYDEKIAVRFPNISRFDQEWILDQVNRDKEEPRNR